MVAQVDARYRSYGLGRYARRLVSYAMFEGRPLTTKGRFINPAVFAWLRLLAAWPGRPRVDRPIFITGLGRSGTTILGVLLSLHREVGFLNEPKAVWHLIDPRQDLNGNYAAAGGVYRLAAADADERATTVAHRLFARYLASTGSQRVLDKYPELIFRADYALRLFPDAKLIFITRSGLDAVPSVVQWSQRLGVQSSAGVDDWWGRNDVKWHYLREQLILPDAAFRAVWPLATPELDHANRAALEWIVTMREGLAQERARPDALVRVSYERLLTDPQGELERLQTACGLLPDPDVVAYARERLYDNPTNQRPALLPAIDAMFAETMHGLGYAY